MMLAWVFVCLETPSVRFCRSNWGPLFVSHPSFWQMENTYVYTSYVLDWGGAFLPWNYAGLGRGVRLASEGGEG